MRRKVLLGALVVGPLRCGYCDSVAARAGAGESTTVFDEIEHELAVLLRRARGFSAMMAREVHPDLDPAAYGLMVRLHETGGARVTDLSMFLGVGKPTISRQVQLMEHLGLVRRDDDPHDKRVAMLVLTSYGARRLRAVRTARRREFRRLLEAWPSDDVRQLAWLLARFNEIDL